MYYYMSYGIILVTGGLGSWKGRERNTGIPMLINQIILLLHNIGYFQYKNKVKQCCDHTFFARE